MILDFNQGASTPVTIDLENIKNRTISVIEEDLVITAPNSILHDNLRVAEIIVEIAKTKGIGSLNLLKKKNSKKKKKVVSRISPETKEKIINAELERRKRTEEEQNS